MRIEARRASTSVPPPGAGRDAPSAPTHLGRGRAPTLASGIAWHPRCRRPRGEGVVGDAGTASSTAAGRRIVDGRCAAACTSLPSRQRPPRRPLKRCGGGGLPIALLTTVDPNTQVTPPHPSRSAGLDSGPAGFDSGPAGLDSGPVGPKASRFADANGWDEKSGRQAGSGGYNETGLGRWTPARRRAAALAAASVTSCRLSGCRGRCSTCKC